MAAKKNLDVRGRACPMPIVELMRVITSALEGDEIVVLADDHAFPADVEAWCRKTGNKLLEVKEQAGAYEARVVKS
jgi:tRNA 2-thiouridine synthesizing protein A